MQKESEQCKKDVEEYLCEHSEQTGSEIKEYYMMQMAQRLGMKCKEKMYDYNGVCSKHAGDSSC